MQVIFFSHNRPLQLWGAIKSLQDNADIAPSDITAVCRALPGGYREAYERAQKELGFQIIWQERDDIFPLVVPLLDRAEYVMFCVDDMMFFRPMNLKTPPYYFYFNVELFCWSYRCGDYSPTEVKTYPFHFDGAVYRARDVLKLWHEIDPNVFAHGNLNFMECECCKYLNTNPDDIPIGHLRPLEQTCVTWAVNKVSNIGGADYFELPATALIALLRKFQDGHRLDYSPHYSAGINSTHMPADEAYTELWLQCVKKI